MGAVELSSVEVRTAVRSHTIHELDLVLTHKRVMFSAKQQQGCHTP